MQMQGRDAAATSTVKMNNNKYPKTWMVKTYKLSFIPTAEVVSEKVGLTSREAKTLISNARID